MIETLDLRDELTVLEIGTGAGYNVALLAERLGPAQVSSIDVDAELIATARARLSTFSRSPSLFYCHSVTGG